jgi:hypothetical protein
MRQVCRTDRTPLHPAIPFLAAGSLAAYTPQDAEAVDALRSADRNTIATVVERDPMADTVIAAHVGSYMEALHHGPYPNLTKILLLFNDLLIEFS